MALAKNSWTNVSPPRSLHARAWHRHRHREPAEQVQPGQEEGGRAGEGVLTPKVAPALLEGRVQVWEGAKDQGRIPGLLHSREHIAEAEKVSLMCTAPGGWSLPFYLSISPPPAQSGAQQKYERERFRVEPGRIENYTIGKGALAQQESYKVGKWRPKSILQH